MAKKEPSLNDVTKEIDRAIKKYMKKVPAAQKKLFDAILLEIKDLDLDTGGRIKQTVKNYSKLSSIQSRINEIMLTPQYESMVKDFVSSYQTIGKLTTDYFRHIDKKFKPKSILKEVRKQAVEQTVKSLTESGIGATVQDEITEVLQSNITAGGTYKGLINQFDELLTNTKKSDGILQKYSEQIVTDAVNQYSSKYNQIISAQIGAEWFNYAVSDIRTTRPFCDAMTDRKYFHISEVPDLIKANDLYYTNRKTGQTEKVPLNPTTGLPAGMIPDTNADNFFIRRGGYRCRHAIRPVTASLVPEETKQRVYATPAYKRFKANQSA